MKVENGFSHHKFKTAVYFIVLQFFCSGACIYQLLPELQLKAILHWLKWQAMMYCSFFLLSMTQGVGLLKGGSSVAVWECVFMLPVLMSLVLHATLL